MNTTTGLTEDELMDLNSFLTYVVTSDEDMPVIDFEMCIRDRLRDLQKIS